MERRAFIKNSCSFCLAASLALIAGTLESCASFPVVEAERRGSKLRVPLQAFGKSDLLLVSAKGLLYDIGIRRHGDGTYTALLLRCTHASNELLPGGGGFSCPAHGSRFGLDGRVLRGPASRPLTHFPAKADGSSVIITIDPNAFL
jgi:Rieske Fe-S protein